MIKSASYSFSSLSIPGRAQRFPCTSTPLNSTHELTAMKEASIISVLNVATNRKISFPDESSISTSSACRFNISLSSLTLSQQAEQTDQAAIILQSSTSLSESAIVSQSSTSLSEVVIAPQLSTSLTEAAITSQPRKLLSELRLAHSVSPPPVAVDREGDSPGELGFCSLERQSLIASTTFLGGFAGCLVADFTGAAIGAGALCLLAEAHSVYEVLS